MNKKKYNVSFKTIEEFVIEINANSKDEAIAKAEDLLIASDFKKLKMGVKSKHYNLCEIKNNKPRFCFKNRGFVFFSK
ncbi:MAG: hypothetical protein Q4G05_01735 [Clostridia bacterium]|nr:hypothetical protein [Clostridia bacterium]